MAVQVWIGEKPENPNERKAIIALASGLERLEGLYVMLANFSVGGRTIDLVILKHDAIFIIELKHCDGKIFGSVNGPWTVVSKSGSTKQLNPGRKNPYNQVISYFYSFTNFLIDHKSEIVSEQKATDLDFRMAKRVIVTVPTLEAGSSVELDWKVQVKGLDELPTYLVVERCNGIELNDAAMERIPHLLHCTQWQEVHDLLRGVMPAWAQTPTDTVPIAAPPVPVAAVASVADSVVPMQHNYNYWRWRTGGSVLTVFAAITLVFSAWWLKQSDQTSTDLAVPVPTVMPLPTIPVGGIGTDVSNGVASVHQAVRRSFDKEQKAWVATADSSESRADVVVWLETVDYTNGKITLNWTIENRQPRLLFVPLTDSNIAITDGTLKYNIDQRLSLPSVALYVQPGERAKATMVVPQPVRPSAIGLTVSLQQGPFGKATWLVNAPSGPR
ncbi:MAG: nuclease-related domain-containing protein [Herpetosiphon sp.]